MQIRYTTKVLRDGGLAATLGLLVAMGEIEKPVIKAAALICAAGAAFCALKRVPLVINELNGFLPMAGLRRMTA